MENVNEIIPITIPNLNTKVIKKTQLTFESLNEYMTLFFNGDNFQESWSNPENQHKFRLFIYEKKIRMKKSKIMDIEAKKLETKEKIQKRKKVPKIVDRPKHAFLFFKNAEVISIKEEFPDLSKIEIHHELQKRWKNIRNVDIEKYNYYNEIAIKENENREPIKITIPDDTKKSVKTMRREKHEKKVEKKSLKLRNKEKYNNSPKKNYVDNGGIHKNETVNIFRFPKKDSVDNGRIYKKEFVNIGGIYKKEHGDIGGFSKKEHVVIDGIFKKEITLESDKKITARFIDYRKKIQV